MQIKSVIRLPHFFLIVMVSTAISLSIASAAIDVEMMLNNSGFVSYDHFKADLYLNNHDAPVLDAWIFGILEIYGEYYYWPDFGNEVNYRTQTILEGIAWLPFLEFDFPNIDEFLPFGPVYFWGAWFLDMDHWGYDVEEFWLDYAHVWTPTPTQTTIPTSTPVFVSVGNMIPVSAGTFTQGSPLDEPCRDSSETQFLHTLTRSLAVMETETTRQMWADLRVAQGTLPADPSNTAYSPGMSQPVQQITWYEATLFANLLSLQNGYIRCYYTDSGFTTPIDAMNYTTEPIYCDFFADGYRLPTEGEWEYFTRAGTTTTFSCNEMNYTSSNCFSCEPGTHTAIEQYCVYCANDPGMSEPAGTKLSNPWNLKDVHGNVWEFCWDWYGGYPTGSATDYTGLTSGSNRVSRGGCWNDNVQNCRSGARSIYIPAGRNDLLGFRLVRTTY